MGGTRTSSFSLDLETTNKQIPKRSDSSYTRNSGREILMYLLIIYKLLFLQKKKKMEATMCIFNFFNTMCIFKKYFKGVYLYSPVIFCTQTWIISRLPYSTGNTGTLTFQISPQGKTCLRSWPYYCSAVRKLSYLPKANERIVVSLFANSWKYILHRMWGVCFLEGYSSIAITSFLSSSFAQFRTHPFLPSPEGFFPPIRI